MNNSEYFSALALIEKFIEKAFDKLSEILNGKRSINLKIAKRLHDKCMVDRNIILELQT